MQLARKSIVTTAFDYLARAGVGVLGRRVRGQTRGRFFLLPDDYIGQTIVAEGAFEKGYLASLDALFDLAARRGLLEAEVQVALDVGANIGTHTVFLSRRFAQVHAFEPNAMLHHVLNANIALNQLKGVTAHRIALSDRSERLVYVQSTDGNLGSSHFNRFGEVTAGSESMPLVRGDETMLECLKPGERVVFAKIDVEGLEDKVVAGLAALLRRDHPLLVIEVAGTDVGNRLREVLAETGYGHLYEIHNPARFNPAGRSAGLAHALTRGIDYHLKPLIQFEDRLYPMVVASPVDLLS